MDETVQSSLYFFLRANRIFFAVHTAYSRKPPIHPKTITPPTKVVVFTGEDKFDLLDRVLAETGFFEILESASRSATKRRVSPGTFPWW